MSVGGRILAGGERLHFGGKRGCDGGVDSGHEVFTRGIEIGKNRRQKLDMDGPGADAESVLGERSFRAGDRDGDDRSVVFAGEEEWAFFEGGETAVGGAGAFGEDDNVEAFGKGLGGLSDTGAGGFTTCAALDGDEFGHAHSSAEHGDIHKGFFEHNNDAARDEGEEDRRIEIGDVVGHKDARLSGRHVFNTAQANAKARGANTETGDAHACAVHPGDVVSGERVGNAEEGGREAEGDVDQQKGQRGKHGVRKAAVIVLR